MTAYGYNSSTMEYTGPVICQLDPVRSQLEGQDRFLQPANSVLVPPQQFDPKIERAMWNGDAWVVEPIPDPEEPLEPEEPMGPQYSVEEALRALIGG